VLERAPLAADAMRLAEELATDLLLLGHGLRTAIAPS
jgi:hypothetical protein